MKNQPIEYKRGFKGFLGCKVDLSLKPMIPRPETEFWLKKAIKTINQGKKKVFCLDIFAGSGCIGIAVLKHTKAKVDFSDIEKKFLKQIKINLKLNKISASRYRVIHSDIFSKLTTLKVVNYDYIFANPPYVGLDRRHLVQESVLDWEPVIAIFGGEDGLFYIGKFLKDARKHLKKDGKIYLEFDHLRKKETEKLLKQLKYKKFKFYKDQFKKWRWVVCA
jgi:release factor glutamine methyltransferase